MTTFDTFDDIDSVPAPSRFDPLTRPPSPRFRPFVAVTDRDQLVTIVAQTRAGLYRDTRGYLYIPATVTRDLAEYAERRAADALALDGKRARGLPKDDWQDQDDTQQDSLGTLW